MPHYYDEEQTSAFEPFLLNIKLKDLAFTVYSASGVFSLRRLDKGTEVLLQYCELPDTGRVLDLGCGYGVVACAVKMRKPECEVLASDVNERSLKLTRMNAKHLNLDIKVMKSNLFDNIETVDVVLVNPPYVAGRKLIFKLIEQAQTKLSPDGNLQLVARHQKGGKMLEAKMQEIFGNVETIGKKAGFRVYKSVKATN